MELLELGLGDRLVPYQEAWDLQRSVHAEVAAGERADTLILVEHESVYTAGKRTAVRERPADGTPVVDVDRGGRITWHGPGQLVAYPIVRLAEPVDVIRYVRQLEQAVIDYCASLGLPTLRVEGRSGVWAPARDGEPERKLCAIGVRVAQGVTMHGLALNCDSGLGEFGAIIPCGIEDAGVASLSRELGRRVGVADAAGALPGFLETALAPVRWSASTVKEGA